MEPGWNIHLESPQHFNTLVHSYSGHTVSTLVFPEKENYWVSLPTPTLGVKAPWCVTAFPPEQSSLNARVPVHSGRLSSQRLTENFQLLKLIFGKHAATNAVMNKPCKNSKKE